jgi:hypothetical protein
VLLVEPTVTSPGGGVFHYEFAITNNTLEDVAIVSLVDAPSGDPLIGGSLMTPTGFQASYDSPLGIVDFLADVAFGIGTTESGFAFDSTAAPGSGFLRTFEALTVNGTFLTGRVQGIPEPGTLTLLVRGLGVWARRRAKACPCRGEMQG